MDKIVKAKKRITDALLAVHPQLYMDDPKQEELYLALHNLNDAVSERARAELLDENSGLNVSVVMPRISHFIDENGNNVDLNAVGVNAKLLRDGTFEYFISYGFAGRKELTPVYGA